MLSAAAFRLMIARPSVFGFMYKESFMTPDIDAQLKQLEEQLPEMRSQHPDDFWDVFRARAEKITGVAESQEQAAQIVKRIDEILATNQLGPADPGA